MIPFQYRSANSGVRIPEWVHSIGYQHLVAAGQLDYLSGYELRVPRIDTSLYLPYLQRRAQIPDASIRLERFQSLEDVPTNFTTIVNCSGYGSRMMVPDSKVESHRGQVVVVESIGNAPAFVLDEPLTYVIPRERDCVFGGANQENSDSTATDQALTEQIMERCTRMARLPSRPRIVTEPVGLRPARKGGVRLEAARSKNGRLVIHNYGHGGCGISLSWGCAVKVLDLIRSFGSA
jgi:D-amino-acid oxidase